MDTYLVVLILLVLISISAFFSSSETAMMALNKYKLKHLAKSNKNNTAAKRSLKLVAKPEKLLITILIGNTFANIFVGTVISEYSQDNFGDIGLLISTLFVTMLVLIFGEIIPKSFAAIYPQKLAFPFSLPIKILMIVLYPLVITLHFISKITLKIFGIKLEEINNESLNKEEIHTVVHESNSKLGRQNKNMLLGVLELDKILVHEVMTHFNKIEYIDINHSVEKNLIKISKMNSSNILLCDGSINRVIGVLGLKKINNLLISKENINRSRLRQLASMPYFIPETVTLQTQLINFQRKCSRFAVVVDDYGDVSGIVTIEDIVEEIVGEFSDRFDAHNSISKISNNTYLIGGGSTLREINRHAGIHFESEDAKTLSGIIIEEIENLPSGLCSIKYNGTILEVSELRDNKIVSIKLTVL